MTGEDQPRPETSVFQTTFSVEPQLCGNVAASATPPFVPPRNWVQLSSAAARGRTDSGRTITRSRARRMGRILFQSRRDAALRRHDTRGILAGHGRETMSQRASGRIEVIRTTGELFPADFVEDVLGHVDGDV